MNNEFENKGGFFGEDTTAETAAPQNEYVPAEPFENEALADVPVAEDSYREERFEDVLSVETPVNPVPEAPVYGGFPAEGTVGAEIPSFDASFAEEPVKRKKSGNLALKIIIPIVASIIVFGGIFLAWKFVLPRLDINIPGITKEEHKKTDVKIGTTEYELTKSDTVAPQSEIAKIAQLRMPSVVAITNRSVSDVITFFGTYSQESTSSGSGIIIGQNDTELLIITNYHVVANAEELSVVFSAVESELEAQSEKNSTNVFDNERIPSATVKGYDAARDIAVIAVYLDEIPDDVVEKIEIAPIGDSTKLLPGDQVIAIGNSLGYGQSVTTGIISAVNRKITMQSSDGRGTVTNSFIQTDAAINQGNSGGALLDMAGNVIGINSVKIATTGVEGMGYAIPISEVESIIENLMSQTTRDIVDKEEQGFLGITGSDVQERDTEMYGIPAGVYVNSVTEGLGADKAGIKKGYVIVEFEGYTISSMTQLQERLRYYADGETVTLKVKVPGADGYSEQSVEVTLSNKSENAE